MQRTVLSLFITAILLSACDQQTSADQSTGESQATAVTVAREASATTPVNADQAVAQATDNAPAADSQSLQPGDPLPTISSASDEAEDSTYQEINWDALMPPDYRPEVVLAKFMEQLAGLEDDDPKAMEIYGKIQAELENAPINEALDGKMVKLPGFIAPLENTDGKVSEFLLVPYYGACIHVPPPPVNQTVLIKTLPEAAIKVDNIYDPIWVKGEILTKGEKTDIGQAGYRIVDAQVEPYEEM